MSTTPGIRPRKTGRRRHWQRTCQATPTAVSVTGAFGRSEVPLKQKKIKRIVINHSSVDLKPDIVLHIAKVVSSRPSGMRQVVFVILSIKAYPIIFSFAYRIFFHFYGPLFVKNPTHNLQIDTENIRYPFEKKVGAALKPFFQHSVICHLIIYGDDYFNLGKK